MFDLSHDLFHTGVTVPKDMRASFVNVAKMVTTTMEEDLLQGVSPAAAMDMQTLVTQKQVTYLDLVWHVRLVFTDALTTPTVCTAYIASLSFSVAPLPSGGWVTKKSVKVASMTLFRS